MACVFCDGRFSSAYANSGFLTADPIAPLMACSTVDGGKCPLIVLNIFRDGPVSYALEMPDRVEFSTRSQTRDAQGNKIVQDTPCDFPDWVFSDTIAIAFFEKLKKEYSEHLNAILSGKTDLKKLHNFGPVAHMILQGEEIVAIDYNPGSDRLPTSYDPLGQKVKNLFSDPRCGPEVVLPDWGFGTFDKNNQDDLKELSCFLKCLPISLRCSDINHYTRDGGYSVARVHWRDWSEEVFHRRRNSLASQYAGYIQNLQSRRYGHRETRLSLVPNSQICYIQTYWVNRSIRRTINRFFKNESPSSQNSEDKLLKFIEEASSVFFD